MIEKLFVIGVYCAVIGVPFLIIGAFCEWYFEKRGNEKRKGL